MTDKEFTNMVKRGVKYAVASAVVLFLALSTWFTTSEGYLYYVQNKLTGSTTVYSEPGVHLKMPLFTNIYEYKRVATIDMTMEDGNFTRNLGAINVGFADTYTGTVPATFRYRLPVDEANFRKLHQDFRSFDNLVDTLLVNNSRNVAVVTATQYTGEEFIQGGVNAYKAQMEDQLSNGLYVTKRQQVEVTESGYADVSSTNSNPNLVQNEVRLVMKNVIVIDNASGQPRRLENPMAEYGIQVTQVTIGKPTADSQLESLLDRKRQSVGEKITAQQEIDTNRVKAEAAKQEREIDKQKAIQDAQKEKELATIQGQQRVEVERQQALQELVKQQKEKDVAVIQKEKELAIAEANRGIQEAAAQAAKFEGMAIREKGLAEADVELAKLSAKQSAKDIYMAEIERDIAQVMYPALKDVTIDMPDFYSGGTGAEAPTSLDVFTTLGALKNLEDRAATTMIPVK
jgi:hypothetical protein